MNPDMYGSGTSHAGLRASRHYRCTARALEPTVTASTTTTGKWQLTRGDIKRCPCPALPHRAHHPSPLFSWMQHGPPYRRTDAAVRNPHSAEPRAPATGAAATTARSGAAGTAAGAKVTNAVGGLLCAGCGNVVALELQQLVLQVGAELGVLWV